MRSGIALSLIVLITVCAPAPAYDFSTNPGDGSQENPYQISTPEQLIEIGSDPNLYNTFKSFALTSNIIFDPNNNPDHVFDRTVIPWLRGNLDGCGFAIINLRISVSTYDNEPVGLIGQTIEGWGIKNLSLQNAQVTVGDNFQIVGILCGLNISSIHNCQVSGTITCGTGSERIGAICGSNGNLSGVASVTHCQSDILISSSSATGTIVDCGGICGYNNRGTISNCSAEGDISAWSLNTTGGICGYQEFGEIISCSTSLDITAQKYLVYSGGLCGINELLGTISHSYSTGNMTSYGTSFYGYNTILRVGGFCGYNTEGFIQSCYSTGDITCNSVELGQGEEAGGFCGRNSASGEILDCFSTGDIICGPITGSVPYRERWVGGFCGTNDGSMINCSSTGTLDTDATDKAGFCYSSSTQENCFWDTDVSGIPVGVIYGDVSGVTGKTTAEMQDENTFLDAAWDFVDETINGTADIWAIESNQYPSIFREFYSGGDGSPQDPFQISSADDLVNMGKHEENYYDCFVLTNDIDLSGQTFDNTLIAPDTGATAGMFHGSLFYGYLNGQGHSIDNLSIQSSAVGKEYIGLFGAIGGFAEVRNLRLQNVSIAGSDMIYVGGVCGLNNGGTIKQCSVSGNIQGKNRIGGISGGNGGYIYDSYVSGDVAAPSTVGGICGMLLPTPGGWGHLERCYSTASIQSDSTYKGGIVGYVGSSAFMKNCYWDTATSGLTSGYYLPPQFWGIIDNVQGYTTSQMKQQANFVGWDFVGETANGQNEIWRMCVDGMDYPRLSWEFAQNGDFACGDGVDIFDLQTLAEHWLMVEANDPTGFNYACDANGDERIDFLDYAVLGENW